MTAVEANRKAQIAINFFIINQLVVRLILFQGQT
jgi:hypothetical protein